MKETKNKAKMTEGVPKKGTKTDASVLSNEKIPICTAYHGGYCSGKCKMRKGHEAWGQSHVCDMCGKDF
ncbi:MAG TPA: hypothetical protein VMW91_06450 [Desulfosporosinus sp.]|nr:hypothetical protein [Desulfosporosinus sp.]HUU39925.1 hypothetical protein [Desulfatiglandales bacterium]